MSEPSLPDPLLAALGAPTAAAEEPRDREPSFTERHLLLLVAATFVAAALRLMNLGEWSFWVDEAHTFRDATLPLDGEQGFLGSERMLYPLAHTLLRALLALGAIGDDEFSLRLPFALVGIASVPLLAFAGRRMVGPAAAVAAAWLCAVHPWHLFWSQNARGYSLVFLFAVLAIAGAARWSVSGRARDLGLFGVSLVFAWMSHPTGALVGVGFVFFVALRRFADENGTRLLRAAAIAAVAIVGACVAFAVLSPFQPFLRAKDDPSLAHLAQTVAFYFRPQLLLVGLVGLVLGGLRWTTVRGLLVACLVLGPFLVLFAIGGTLAKTTARYAYATLPLWLLLAGKACVPWFAGAAGGAAAASVRFLPAVLLALAVGSDLVVEAGAYHGAQHGQRARWREACGFARSIAAAAPTNGRLRALTVNHPSVTYYLQRGFWGNAAAAGDPEIAIEPLLEWRLDGREEGVVLHEPGGRAHLRWQRDQAASRQAALVVLVTMPELIEIDRDGSLRAALQEDFELVLHLPCWVGPKDESVYVYTPRSDR